MNYLDIQNNVQAILNRRDVTSTQLKTFIGLAIQRIQRNLRVPAMEVVTQFTMATGDPTVPVPGDLLEIIDLSIFDSLPVKLVRKDKQTAMSLSTSPGRPTTYYRDRAWFIVGPNPGIGTVFDITYYQDASNLLVDTDTNWLTLAAPDLLIYGALMYAGDFFIDDRSGPWEARYTKLQIEVQDMADRDELINASISPAYNCEYD